MDRRPQPAPDAELPAWLAEILHVVAGFADREHERGVPAHAQLALADVPAEILTAAAIRR